MNASFTVKKRRKREGKTDYKKRIALISSGKPWVTIRKTSTKIITQLIRFNNEGDDILSTCLSSELKKHGWTGSFKNIPAAYLTGYLFGKRVLDKGYNEIVYDVGLQTSHPKGKIYAVLKGIKDSGLKFNCKEDSFPDENRLKGEHTKTEQNEFDKVKKSLDS